MTSIAPHEWEERGADTGLDKLPETFLKDGLGTCTLLVVWKLEEQSPQ